MNYSLLAVGPFGIFDGSIVAIFKHLPLVFAIAYGVPAALAFFVTKYMGLDMQFLLWPFQWLLAADPSQAAQIQSAVKSEVGKATAALSTQLDRIESQLQPKDVAKPAGS